MYALARILSILLILVGLGLLLYGGNELLQSYMKENERLEEARAFISEETKTVDEAADVDYHFEHGETIGMLYIPRFDRELPIVEGTEPEDLKEGVGIT